MRTIDGKRMKELLAKKQARTIDVDTAAAFKREHIKGSVNIPHSDKNFLSKVEQQFSARNEEIVLCGQSGCEKQLQKLGSELEKAGYKNVYQYKADPAEWKASGLNVQKML